MYIMYIISLLKALQKINSSLNKGDFMYILYICIF
jgi:hypothetical protein